MRRRNFRPLTEASPKISIRDHNDLMRTIEGLSRSVTGPHVAGSSNSTGNISSVLAPAFWAKLTFIDTGSPTPLSYAEQLENPDGTLTDFADQHLGFAPTDPANPNPGLQNWPAYDLTGSTHKVGDIVRLIPSKGGEYYEVVGSGAGSSLIPTFVYLFGTTGTANLYSGIIETMVPNQIQLSPGNPPPPFPPPSPNCWIFAPMGLTLNVGAIYLAIPNGTFTPQGQAKLPLYFAIGGWASSCNSGVLSTY